CCSQHGYCDISDAYCGSKCQSEFGLCYGSHDKCGEQYGRYKDDKCCSKWFIVVYQVNIVKMDANQGIDYANKNLNSLINKFSNLYLLKFYKNDLLYKN
ncbi:hypothetical protein LY90DRAFT_420327, partial [Neocallimastix californiae]